MADDRVLDFAGPYAYPTDAADNPVDCDAPYGAVEAGLKSSRTSAR